MVRQRPTAVGHACAHKFSFTAALPVFRSTLESFDITRRITAQGTSSDDILIHQKTFSLFGFDQTSWKLSIKSGMPSQLYLRKQYLLPIDDSMSLWNQPLAGLQVRSHEKMVSTGLLLCSRHLLWK